MSFSHSSRRYSEGAVRRNRIAFYEKGPGPAGYILPGLVGRKDHAVTHLNNPEYSIRRKFPFKALGIGPGAGAYLIPTGMKARPWNKPPAYTCRIKTKIDFRHPGPGPANYKPVAPNVYKWKGPAYSIQSIHEVDKSDETPGPNLYILPPAIGPRVPDKISAPEITLKGLRSDKPKVYTPKSAYHINYDLILPRAPAFTMLRRWPEKKITTHSCGPASYKPKDCQCTRLQAPSFSYRYNDFTGLLRTECDRAPYEPLD